MAQDKPRNIVVAVDDSEHSKYALEWALRCVVRRDTDMVYLVAVERPDTLLASPRGSPAAIPEDDAVTIEEEKSPLAGTVLDRAENICQSKHVTSVCKTYKGDAREQICQACEDLRSDMLILGSRGLGAIKRAFVGSVSHHCARYARCPVIVVHPKEGV